MTNARLTENKTIRAGIVQGPGEQAYRLMRDIHPGMAMSISYFEAMGGAPALKENEPLPKWLEEWFDAMAKKAFG